MTRFFALLLLALCPLSLALLIDEAGVVDYALTLLGSPQQHDTLFARPLPRSDSKASLLYTLSDRAVLGAVNPKSGALVWRQPLNSSYPQIRAASSIGHDQGLIYTGAGSTVSAWSAADGRLVWDKSFPGSHVRDVKTLELGPGDHAATDSDALVVLGGAQNAAFRLDALTGSVKWSHHDASSDTLHAISPVGPKLQLVTLRSSMMKGQKIRVAGLDPATGKLTDNVSPSSEDVSSLDDVVGLGVSASSPVLLWTDSSKTSLKVNVLGSRNVDTFDIKPKSGTIEKISAHGSPSFAGASHFLVAVQTSQDHYALVYHIDAQKGKVSQIHDIPSTPGSGSFSAATVDGKLYFVQTTLTDSHLYPADSPKPIASWPSATGLTPSSLDTDANVRIVHSASEVVARSAGSFAVRTAAYLASGHWVMIQNGQVSWSRPEMLAGLVKAEWAEPHEADALAEELNVETHVGGVAALLHRLTRHAADLRLTLEQASVIPQAVGDWIMSFVGGDDGLLAKDRAFGFDKRVIAATAHGDIVVIDPLSPDKVVLQWADEDYSKMGPSLWNASTVGSLNGKLAQRLRLNSSFGQSESNVLPNTAVVSYTVREDGLEGLLNKQPIWHFVPGKGQKIIGTTSALADEPVASIGRVLGDRRVLYKYLNPNVILVTAADEALGHLTVSVLDSVSGGVLYSASHAGVDLSRPLSSAVTENWFTYSFTSEPADEAQSRGYQLVMGELYESEIPNDRGPLASNKNLSALTPAFGSQGSVKPHVSTHSYLVPEEISHMAVTQTLQGITSRQLLVYLADSGSIVGIPHHALDPRRPVGRDPTRQESEEGIMRYFPFIDFDPKWHLTHSRDIVGIEQVMTTASSMESTSLVFAYGQLDVFGTRISPSFSFDILGNGFNKGQLLLTVFGLLIGTFAVAPFVKRKQTNALWQT